MAVADELEIALAPVLFGGGRRLFDNLSEPEPQFRIDKVIHHTPALCASVKAALPPEAADCR